MHDVNFDYLWQRDDLADLKLTVQWIDSDTQEELKLHSQVLIHFSQFFRGALTSGVGALKRKNPDADGCSYSLAEKFDAASDGSAVRATLDYMYNQPFEIAVSDITLINIMRVADKWEAEIPLRAASSILRNRRTISMRNAVYSLPTALRDNPAFFSVMLSAKNQLLDSFRDARSIFVTPTLLQQFNILQPDLVEVILSTPRFTSDSEETVLHLLRSWCRANPNTDHDILVQLRSHIRYSCISAPYSLGVCDPGVLPPLTSRQMAQLCECKKRNYLGNALMPALAPYSSLEWYQTRRPQPEEYEGVSLKLSVSVAELERLLECISVGTSSFVNSDEVYGEGFFWALKLDVIPNGDLVCSVSVRGVVIVNDSGADGAGGELSVYANFKMYIEASSPLILSRSERRYSPQLVFSGTLQNGFKISDLSRGINRAASLDWWQRFIEKGVVNIKAVVTLAI